MKIATTLSIETKHPTAVAVGFFDGVHLGHRAVIESALAEQRNGLECCVFSFAMNGSAPAAKRGARLLQSITLKKQTLEEMGADWLLIPHFSNFMGLTPEQFAVDVLLRGLHARVVCCGYDYRFGKGACAGAAELAGLLTPYGVAVRQIGAVLDGAGRSAPPASAPPSRPGGWRKQTACSGVRLPSTGRWSMGANSGISSVFPLPTSISERNSPGRASASMPPGC